MKVVADSSPLIALAKIRQFDLLRRLFGSVIIPAEVYAEVVVAGAGLTGAPETGTASWIEVRHLKDRSALAAAHERFALDLGELSVLVLANEIGADLLLLDDLAARRLARVGGFRVQGTVGIVEAGFTRGYLKDLRGAFGELLTRGVFLDPAFLNARLNLLNLPPLSDS